MVIPSWAELYAPVIARVLMGGMFVMAGVQKFMGLDATAGYIASVDLPAPMLLAVLVAALEVIAGAALVLGMRVKLAAAALAVFVIVATILFHTGWSANQMQMTLFIKNLAIVAGLLYMMSFGAGRYALGSR